MSKTITKVIAALGVVAGLGVAALPLSSYAAVGLVPVEVTVEGMFTVTPDSGNATIAYTNVSTTDGVLNNQNAYVTVTDNNGSTHNIFMGVDNTGGSGTINLIGSGAAAGANIPGSVAPASGVSGWHYGFAAGGAGTVTTFKTPVLCASGNASCTDSIANNAAVTNGTASYTIGANVSVSPTQVAGTYTNNIVVYAVENI